MNSIKRRLERLARSRSSRTDWRVGLADRIEAAVKEIEAEKKADPEGYRQRRLQELAELEAAPRDDRYASTLESRIEDARRAILRAELEQNAVDRVQLHGNDRPKVLPAKEK